MTRTLYVDCGNGIAGDMLLGSLVDLGVAPSPVIHAVASMDLEGELRFEPREGGTKAVVVTRETHAHRRLRDILPLLEASDLSAGATGIATRVFRRLADAEAAAHDTTPDAVTFHEVGAVDSIMDIAGIAFAVDELAPERVLASRVNLGSGTVDTAHGTLTVPAPAVVELLADVADHLDFEDTGFEMTTPTGAAVLRTLLADADFGAEEPAWRGAPARGYGFGDHDLGRPRPLGVMLGDA